MTFTAYSHDGTVRCESCASRMGWLLDDCAMSVEQVTTNTVDHLRSGDLLQCAGCKTHIWTSPFSLTHVRDEFVRWGFAAEIQWIGRDQVVARKGDQAMLVTAFLPDDAPSGKELVVIINHPGGREIQRFQSIPLAVRHVRQIGQAAA